MLIYRMWANFAVPQPTQVFRWYNVLWSWKETCVLIVFRTFHYSLSSSLDPDLDPGYFIMIICKGNRLIWREWLSECGNDVRNNHTTNEAVGTNKGYICYIRMRFWYNVSLTPNQPKRTKYCWCNLVYRLSTHNHKRIRYYWIHMLQ